MVNSCCVVGCANRQNKEKGISLHRIPQYPLWRREAWIQTIHRLDVRDSSSSKQTPWIPTPYSRVCSVHFLEGKPSEEPTHPDFVPNQNLSGKRPVKGQALQRHERRKKRSSAKATNTKMETETPSELSQDLAASALLELSESSNLTSTATQTEALLETEKIHKLEKDLIFKDNVIKRLQKTTEFQNKKIKSTKLTFETLDCNKLTFYTGIPNHLFSWIFAHIEPHVQKKNFSSLSLRDHLLLVLTKIRLGLTNKDLAYRFLISESTVSRIWNTWVPILATCLKPLIKWPERDVARSNIPESFKPEYNKVISIIDCFEIFIERPHNLTARAQTWSNYKHNNTIKYLISVSPSGGINFISEGWGGRVSDKQITLESKYMSHLLPGDEVLADRGFLVSEEMAASGVVLRIPAFTKGKKQLSGYEVEASRKLSHVRIHVERVIGRLRKFQILETNIPVSQVHLLDDVVLIVSALHNLLPSIVVSQQENNNGP